MEVLSTWEQVVQQVELPFLPLYSTLLNIHQHTTDYSGSWKLFKASIRVKCLTGEYKKSELLGWSCSFENILNSSTTQFMDFEDHK
jgi:hypothetical protein